MRGTVLRRRFRVIGGVGGARWDYFEEVALAEDDLARLAFLCPPRRSTNTAQRKPVGVLAGTAALAQMFDEIERPGQLFDEAVGAADRVGGAAGAAPK